MTYAKEALALMALKCRKREKIQKKMSGSVVMMPEESEEKEDDDEARDTIDDAATVRVSRTGTGRQRQEEQPVNLGGRSEHWP